MLILNGRTFTHFSNIVKETIKYLVFSHNWPTYGYRIMAKVLLLGRVRILPEIVELDVLPL